MNIDFPEKIKGRSIVVMGSPRTGSTAFCHALHEHFNLPYYSEVFREYPRLEKNKIDIADESDRKRSDIYWENYNLGRKSIVKIFPNHTLTPEEFDRVITDSFVIMLKRRNLVEQISSFYLIQRSQKTRFYKWENPEDSWAVDISEQLVRKAIEQLLWNIKETDNRKQYVDLYLYYEDIIPDLINRSIKPYPKPVNFLEVQKIVAKLLPEYL